jgi:hypothetical protein
MPLEWSDSSCPHKITLKRAIDGSRENISYKSFPIRKDKKLLQ